MSKVIRAVNAMISNPTKIKNVVSDYGKYYFLYGGKYVWAIYCDDSTDVYLLDFYPKLDSTSEIARSLIGNYMTYNTKDLGTREARDTFVELYQLVKGKVFGVDKTLDDIIKDEPLF